MYTHAHGRTPSDERSARRTNFYLENTQHSQDTNIHESGGIRTRNPNKRVTADPLLRPRSHRGLFDTQIKAKIHVRLNMYAIVQKWPFRTGWLAKWLKHRRCGQGCKNGATLEWEAKEILRKMRSQATVNSVALVRERTIPTERPPPVGEVSANFCG